MSFQLKRLMGERGINITKLSEMTGITNANISNMIHGKTSPNLDTMGRLAKALGVSTWELLKDPNEGDEAGVMTCPKCGSKFKIIE